MRYTIARSRPEVSHRPRVTEKRRLFEIWSHAFLRELRLLIRSRPSRSHVYCYHDKLVEGMDSWKAAMIDKGGK